MAWGNCKALVEQQRKPGNNRLSPLPSRQKTSARVKRVKKYELRFDRQRKITLSFRRFRTSKPRRSKLIKQFVIQTPFKFPREIALAYHPKHSRRRSKSSSKVISLQQIRLPAAPLLLMAFGLSGITYFGLNFFQPFGVNPNAQVIAAPVAAPASAPPATPQTTTKSLGRSEPTRIRVPKISLDASIGATGLKADGSMNVPDVFDSAMWYNGSPTPGEVGPSVVVGHVDSYTGIAVFWRLRELVAGDQVFIDRADGSTATFKIEKAEQLPQDNFPAESVYGNVDHAGLRLITCSGTFNEATQRYSHNTVLYGRLE